ncbi:MAG: heparin lyase I family protein [Solirubrobacterales bacterium]
MRRLLLLVVPWLLAGALLCATALALTGSPFATRSGHVPDATASASRGGLLFNGNNIRDFADIQAAPHAITEVPDPLGGGEKVLKMTVHDQDVAPITPTENPRAQALTPALIHIGDEFWLRTEFLIPKGKDFPARVPGWMALLSVYGPPYDGSSPWQIDVSGRQMLWERNENYDFDTPWKAPLVRGRWVSVLLHERFDDDGWVEMWIDGKPVTFFARGTSGSDNRNHHAPSRRLRMATADWSNDGGPNSVRISQYREEGMFEVATVYWKALKIGTSRAAVGG